MSEKPEHNSVGTPEEAMLSDILDRAASKISEPSQPGSPSEPQQSGFGEKKRDSGANELSPQAEASEQSFGVPIETQQSGFDGERRDSGADELSPQAEASEQSLSRRVSRETSESEEKASSPPAEKNKRSSVYLYLLVLFGAAFLMLLLAYFVQQRNNESTISGLQDSWNLSREELVEENQRLETERAQLQADLDREKNQASRTEEENEELKQYLADARAQLVKEGGKARAASYLWYVDQFMRARDYPVAAAAIVFAADPYHGKYADNPAQNEQYQSYRQELIDREYLRLLDHVRDGGTDIWFTERWDPSQNDDMAALCILWCALDQHFVQANDNAASQYLYAFPLAGQDYQERVDRLGSTFTLDQFQAMKDDLVELDALYIDPNGTMTAGGWIHTEEAYGLPFELPPEQLAKIKIPH